MLNIIYAECPLSRMSFMLNAFKLNATVLNVVMLNVVMLSAVMLNVVMLKVVAPFLRACSIFMFASSRHSPLSLFPPLPSGPNVTKNSGVMLTG